MFHRASVTWYAASRLAKSLTVIVLGTGAITGIAAAVPIIEPYWYVSRGELRLIMDKQAVATDRQTLFQLQEYLTRAKGDPAAATSPIVRERIRKLEKLIEQAESRLLKATGGQ